MSRIIFLLFLTLAVLSVVTSPAMGEETKGVSARSRHTRDNAVKLWLTSGDVWVLDELSFEFENAMSNSGDRTWDFDNPEVITDLGLALDFGREIPEAALKSISVYSQPIGDGDYRYNITVATRAGETLKEVHHLGFSYYVRRLGLDVGDEDEGLGNASYVDRFPTARGDIELYQVRRIEYLYH